MTLTAPLPPEVDAVEAPKRSKGRPVGVGEKSGGWFVRITILVVVLIWLIPVVGVLITSFRSEQLANTTGWWEAFADPFKHGQWTLDNYQQALDRGGFQNAFLNSLAVTIPSTIIPITIAAFAAYAFSWMQFRSRWRSSRSCASTAAARSSSACRCSLT